MNGAVKIAWVAAIAVAVAVSAAVLLYGGTGSWDEADPSVIPDSVASANNGFAVDFYREVSAGDGNIFLSPASMYVAFSMLYEGAGGETAGQMLDVFGFEPDAEIRHNATAHTLSSLNRQDPHAELAMANSVWLYSFEPPPSYVDIVRGTYLADIEEYDTPEEGAMKINAWASDKTRGKITKVIEPKDISGYVGGMVLANAVYFKGTWVTQFPGEETRESDFWLDPERSVRADFMNVQGNFRYAQADGVQALKLPYKGDRLSMLVLLPSERDGISALEDVMSAKSVSEWQQASVEREVIVSMPRFKMELTYDLTEPLQELGMTDVFDSRIADLSGILPGLFVDDALQKTYVDVNEEGTEAAAVTVIDTAAVSGPPAPPKFVADHPFIFIIQDDESGAILFMGRLSDPTA